MVLTGFLPKTALLLIPKVFENLIINNISLNNFIRNNVIKFEGTSKSEFFLFCTNVGNGDFRHFQSLSAGSNAFRLIFFLCVPQSHS